MSRLELRLLRSDLQCRLGAIPQRALGKKVKFPGVVGNQIPIIASKARGYYGLVFRSLIVDSQAVNRIRQIFTDIVKATHFPLFHQMLKICRRGSTKQFLPCLRDLLNAPKDPHMLTCPFEELQCSNCTRH